MTVSEELNRDFLEIELKIYDIKQVLLFFCCTGFKNYFYVLSKYIEGFQRSIR